jgi:hypothetical protein
MSHDIHDCNSCILDDGVSNTHTRMYMYVYVPCTNIALPDSIKKFKLKSFSLLGLEQALQQRINQHTSRDSDRFRQILKLFKEQTKRGDTDEDTALMGVNRSQFATVCLAVPSCYIIIIMHACMHDGHYPPLTEHACDRY